MTRPVQAVAGRLSGNLRQHPGLWTAGLLGSFCGLLFLKSWWMGLGFLAALAIGIVGVWHPMRCWKGITLFLILLANYTPPPLDTFVFWGGATLFVAGCWLQLRRSGISPGWVDRALGVSVLVWVAWTYVCALGSFDVALSVREATRYALSFACLFTYLNWIRTPGQAREMLEWWGWLVIGVSAFWALEFFLQILRGADVHSYLFLGPYPPTHNERSLFPSTLLPVLVSLFFAAPRQFGWGKRVLIVTLLCTAMVWSQARTSWVTATVALMIVLARFSPRRFWQASAVLAVIGVAVMVTIASIHGDLGTGLMKNLSGRNLVWGAALVEIGSSPILGIGPGCWSLWFGRHFNAADFLLFDARGNSFVLDPSRLGGEAHNLLLTKAVEMGLPAALLTLWLFLTWIRAAGAALRQIPDPWFRAVAIGSFAAVCGTFVGAFFENGPFIGAARGGQVLIVWFLAALPLVLARAFREEASGQRALV